MPAGQGKDTERFAAAVESRTPLGAVDDADLARELEIVAMLRSRGAAFAPGPDVKERARQRLMAVLAAEQAGPDAGPRPAPRHAAAPPTAGEITAPLGRIARDDVDPTAETTVMAPVTELRQPTAAESSGSPEDADDDHPAVDPTPLREGRAGRRARHSRANRPAGRAGSARRPAAGGLRRRAVLVGSAAMVMMIAIASGGIFASRDALPGDNLYAVKRAAESAGLALTFDEAGKARRHLEIAATRLSEVERLAAAGTQTAPAPEVFTTAMDEFDAATDEGSQMLLAAAESDAASTAAGDLRTWAAEQSARLTELRPALPAAVDTDRSIELLDRLLGRTEALEGGQSCEDGECTSGDTSDPNTSESGSDAAEDPTSTPNEDGSTSTRDSGESSRTPTETPDGENPQLLPDLLPDANRDGGSEPSGSNNEDEDSTSSPDSESGDEGSGGNVEVPVPLLPPVTLPPLLPGVPGITIG